MKSTFRYIVFCLVLVVNQKATCQNNDFTSKSNFFKLKNFTLVYGNANFDIHDFFIHNNQKVLLLTKSNGALFYLLDSNNLATDTLFFKSAPANIKFGNNNETFYYQSIFFYKSNLCKLDYKPGVASFYIKNNSLVFNKCLPIDDSYVRDELFQKTENFKVSLLLKENNKRKKKKSENEEDLYAYGNIGFAVNDKYIVKRKAPSLKNTMDTFFPFTEINNKLYVYDVLANSMYKFTDNENYTIDTIQNSIRYNDTINSFVSYNLLSDQGTSDLYLLKSQRIIINRKGREKQKYKENQVLYILIDNKWVLVNYEIPLFSYKIHIDYKKIYSVFNVEDERGVKRKTLYISNTHIQ
ncbi:MAG: hypothetical protein RBR97_20300 [Bacteroidales bacterium]|nr:hypothetical protein [Bacteroidales bacterium]